MFCKYYFMREVIQAKYILALIGLESKQERVRKKWMS